MLSHSIEHFGAEFLVCDAAQLPYEDGSISLILSSLGDPYNLPSFWNEVRRVLANDGVCYFTSPSYEWAKRFRKDDFHQGAEFLVNNRLLRLPSYIYPQRQQASVLSEAGLVIDAQTAFMGSKLQTSKSSKLDVFGPNRDGPIVEGFRVRKSLS